jgi:dienelactone hydrolase
VNVRRRTIDTVPLLLVSDRGRAPRPAAFWFHGFNSDANANRAELERLAAAGFLAIGVDAVGHGARRWPNLDDIAAAAREETLRAMRIMVNDTAHELGTVIDVLAAEGEIDDRIGVAGVSMGGYLVYRALTLEPRIRAAVALLGSPDDIHDSALHPTALLSITAQRDVNVPPTDARALHDRLRWPTARYMEIEGAEHLMTQEQWNHAMDETVNWLTTYAMRAAAAPAARRAAR